MKLRAFLVAVLIVAVMPAVSAQGSDHSDFSGIQHLLENPVPCEQLTDEQLESLGEYVMEQRHPGEAHDAMDEMMGGEGSESLRQAHIRMGEAFYCGTSGGMDSGMMGVGSGMMGLGMMYGYGWIYILVGVIIVLLLIIILLLRRK